MYDLDPDVADESDGTGCGFSVVLFANTQCLSGPYEWIAQQDAAWCAVRSTFSPSANFWVGRRCAAQERVLRAECE